MHKSFVIQELVSTNVSICSDSDHTTTNSSSTSSDSEEESVRYKRTRIENYVETVVPAYTDKEFQKHFRMKRVTAYRIIELLKESNKIPTHEDGRKKVSPEKAFLMMLWYLGNIETFRQMADRFNCTESTVYKTIKRVLLFLLEIKSDIIKWPSADQAAIISDNFKAVKGIENVIGAIDGSHIEIPKPEKNQEAYCNRKGYHSLLLQSIVDNNKKFIDVFCGEPGSMNDARLLRKSGIYKKMHEDPDFMGNYFLLGDSAYPNLHWIVTPFVDNGNLSREQKQFNYLHSATRIIVENSFGLLKGRFRRLRKLDNRNVLLCSQLIMAACILHNICINYGDIVENNDENDFNQPEKTFAQLSIPGGNSRQIEAFQKLFQQ